jgi:hypothetical protein
MDRGMWGRLVIRSPSGSSKPACAGALMKDMPAAIMAALKKVARLAHPVRRRIRLIAFLL